MCYFALMGNVMFFLCFCFLNNIFTKQMRSKYVFEFSGPAPSPAKLVLVFGSYNLRGAGSSTQFESPPLTFKKELSV